MAIQEGPIFLEGVTINGVIYYKWRDLYLMRVAPGKGGVKQTAETKKSSRAFGVASRAARLLYRSFESVIPAYLHNREMHNRVRAVMRKIVGRDDSSVNSALWNYSYLEGFAFNNQATFSSQIFGENICRIGIKNSITVSVPKLNLKHIPAPKTARYLSLRLMAIVFDFRNNKQKANELLEIRYDYQDSEISAKEAELHFSKRFKVGDVVIVALQMAFLDSRNKQISSVKVSGCEVSEIIRVFVIN